MQVVYGCVICLLWTIVSSATASKVAELQSEPLDEAVAIETGKLVSSLSTAGPRSKRRLPGDSSTYFVGLYVQRAALPGNYTRILKVVAYRVARSTRGRTKRGLLFGPKRRPPFHLYTPAAHLPRPRQPQETVVITEHHHHNVYVPVHHRVEVPVEHKVYYPVEHKVYVQVTPTPTTLSPSAPITTTTTTPAPITTTTTTPAPITTTTTTPAPPQNLTRTQQVFNVINGNPQLANNFREEFLREFNRTILPTIGGYIDPAIIEAANRLVVVRETGITCMDVCSSNKGDVVGYGTIGICTPRFCQCDFNLGAYTRFDCYNDKVFDPISLSCKSPLEVILCNDEELEELQGPAVNAAALSGNVASVAPSSASLLGSSGNQALLPVPASLVTPPSSLFNKDNQIALTSTFSSSVVASQQAQVSPLQPSGLQSPNQVRSEQVVPSSGQTIQQILQSLQLILQQNPALSQFAISALLSSPNPFPESSVDKQGANGPAQILQNVLGTPQPFATVQQQQIVTPTASSTTSLNSLTQSGILNESNKLSPNQMVQLAELVRALGNTNRNSGMQRATEIQAFPPLGRSLGSSSIENQRPSEPAQTVQNIVRTPQVFSTSLQQQFVAPNTNTGTLWNSVETQRPSEPAQAVQNVVRRPQSIGVVQQQQFVIPKENPRIVLDTLEDQRASEPAQLVSNAVRRPQFFPTVERQQFATPSPNVRTVSSIEIHRANELAQFEQNSVSAPQSFPTVPQQFGTPTANPKTVLALLTQSGHLNEILQLTPNQREQLDHLVRALASKNEHFGTLKEPKVSADQILHGGYN